MKYNKFPKKSQKYLRLGKTCFFIETDVNENALRKWLRVYDLGAFKPEYIYAHPFLAIGLFPRLDMFRIARAFFRVTFDELRKNRDRDRDRLFVFDLKVTTILIL